MNYIVVCTNPKTGRVIVTGPFADSTAATTWAGLYRQSVPGPNVENIRSSSQSKRDVSPRPKGGKT